ncbi:translation initiation factor IF-2 [bacterium DOLZORAL124_38_8]|nr:MAG: translation initiation factor IF-2 [bacterium DOLZORAL124_38_8]
MSISINDLAKKLEIAPEAVILHAMDVGFDIPEDDMIPDDVAAEIESIELGDEIRQTEHQIQDQLDREIIESQQKKTAGSKKKSARKTAADKEKKEREAQKLQERNEVEVKKSDDGTIILPESMTVRELSIKIGKPIPIVLVKMKQNGIIANLKEDVDFDTASIIASELGIKVRKESAELSGDQLFRGDLKSLLAEEEAEDLVKRPPVVSIMGHVDHGKTSILDYIRKSAVADGEAGGITQRIGAYQVDVKGETVTFLDTPGHEAFTAMRARGARATDIAILVVAGNEGVKPQTIEAINHAKAAEIPIIVAINKMDIAGANPEIVKGGLAENNLTPEDWGGDAPCIPVSAKTGMGIDDLLDMVVTVADLQELKANPNRPAIATVIEANMDSKTGMSATVLVNTGTLKQRDSFVIYDQNGRIRTMKNYQGKLVKVAPPSTPVEITGLDKMPQMGDLLQVMKNDKIARKKAEEVGELLHTDKLSKKKKNSLATLKAKIAEGRMNQLKIVVKADSNGTLEAVKAEVEKIRTEDSFAKIIHAGAGEISESDLMLASAGDAIVVGFNIKSPGRIKKLAEKEGVDMFEYDVIYHLTEKIQDILEGNEEAEETETIIGQFVAKAVFAANKKMAVVGGAVLEGFVKAKTKFRLFRKEKDEDRLMGTGKVDTVQIGQKEEEQVGAGTDCGMKLSHKDLEFLPGDRLEIFTENK